MCTLNKSTKQVLLEEFIPEERLKLLYAFCLKKWMFCKLESKIETEVKEQVNRFQKDYYLREQIRAIRKELEKRIFLMKHRNIWISCITLKYRKN